MSISEQNSIDMPTRFLGLFALSILVLAFVAEGLPLIFGTGVNAKWDWGFIYVSMRFVVLPLICLIHLCLFLFQMSKHKNGALHVRNIGPLVVSIGYLVLLFFHPESFVG